MSAIASGSPSTSKIGWRRSGSIVAVGSMRRRATPWSTIRRLTHSASSTLIEGPPVAKQAYTEVSRCRTRVRMYRHGLGDCFLIRFPRIGPNRSDFCILVDCGLIPSSVHTDTDRIMEAVVQDIGWTTDFHLDVVAVSSKRWDHVSGFDPEKGWFNDFQIDQVWLPWTADPRDSTLRSL